MSVTSMDTKNRPRLKRKQLGERAALHAGCAYNHAARPLRKTNVGAHRWAVMRVKKRAGEVACRSIGSDTLRW
jgi:hypothetical protein